MHLDAIYVHPIKSCRGVALPEAVLDDRGLVHDRRYMLVDEAGRFISLRSEPRLAKVHVVIEEDGYRVTPGDQGGFELPFGFEEGPSREVSIWDDRVEARVHEAGSSAMSKFLGVRVWLVHMPNSTRRRVDPRFARADDQVGFADAYPLLMLSRATIDDVSRRVGARMEMARFRPNLVLAGVEAYQEDLMAELRIGEVSFRGPKACSRCVATTVDPRTGVSGLEPLRTLAGYRREKGKIWLGMNLVHDSHGRIRVGDPVEIVREYVEATDARP